MEINNKICGAIKLYSQV